MSANPLASVDWKAPAGDGEILVWPEPASLVGQTWENHRRLSSAGAVRVQGVPLGELRQSQRQWVGHGDAQRPLIATGHQIELLHPGVWAKNVLIDALARKTGGAAYHLAVDTDAPKHLQLRWPGGSMPVTDDPRLATADWAGMLDGPTPAHLGQLERVVKQAAEEWAFEPMVSQFIDAMRRLLMESAGLTSQLVNAMHQIDWEVGLRHHAMPVSPIWMSPPYLVFVHHVLARAEQFASIYNRVLGSYRAENKIRNAGRPWPDLRRIGDACEVPFWLDFLDRGERWRGSVVVRSGQCVLKLNGDAEFGFETDAEGWVAAEKLGRFLMSHNARLSPRALTLTAFVRLLLADQFVHGIGGGRYDRITDEVIARFFGLEPPAFSVTTATLLFPSAAGQKRIDLHALRHEGRRLRHGASLGDQKMEMVRRIASLPHRSIQRRELFRQMHQRLAEIVSEPVYRDWQRRYDEAQGMRRRQEVIFDRELFYAIQSEERLKLLIGRYDELLK